MLRLGCNTEIIKIIKQHNKHTVFGNLLLGGGSTGYDTLFKVELFKGQSLVAFPKFSTFAIGFRMEKDSNTNLPYVCDALQIYSHIKCNKLYKEITKEECIAAIKMLQIACGVLESIVKNNKEMFK